MRRNILRAVLAVATVAGTASAAPSINWESGLTFYSDNFQTPVANVATPDGECHAFPATATALVGWSHFENVIAYGTADCSGQATGLGTLRTFQAGRFVSFIAY